jgi:hypothetical protein
MNESNNSVYADGAALGGSKALGYEGYGLGRISDKAGNCLLEQNPNFVKTLEVLNLGNCIQPKRIYLPKLRKHSYVFVVNFNDPNAKTQKVNEGELVATWILFNICEKHNIPNIYIDSTTVHSWAKGNGAFTDTLKRQEKNKLDKFRIVKDLQRIYLTLMERPDFSFELLNGSPNPADFGYHKNKGKKGKC